MLQAATMSRPRPTIHIHSMDDLYNIAQPQFLGSRKRKRSSGYSSEDDDAVASYMYPAPTSPVKTHSPSAEDDSEADHKNKRARRALNIERGMGDMSLNGQMSQASYLPASVADSGRRHLPARSSLDHLNAHNISEPEHLEVDEDFGFRDHHLDDDLEIVTPNVEEASSPIFDDIDVSMKTMSWYEPEKDRELHPVNRVGRSRTQTSIIPPRAGIVVTDLSDSETDQEDGQSPQYWDDSHESYPQFIISPAYLQRVSGVPKLSFPSAEPENSMALVAYRPVHISQPDKVEEPNPTKTGSRTDTGDAMDIDD